MVVEPARQDLDLAAVGQAPVGEVRLPALVGRRGLEAVPRSCAGACAGSGVTPARRRWSTRRMVEVDRDRLALAAEVPGDRDRPRVKTPGGELGAQG